MAKTGAFFRSNRSSRRPASGMVRGITSSIWTSEIGSSFGFLFSSPSRQGLQGTRGPEAIRSCADARLRTCALYTRRGRRHLLACSKPSSIRQRMPATGTTVSSEASPEAQKQRSGPSPRGPRLSAGSVAHGSTPAPSQSAVVAEGESSPAAPSLPFRAFPSGESLENLRRQPTGDFCGHLHLTMLSDRPRL